MGHKSINKIFLPPILREVLHLTQKVLKIHNLSLFLNDLNKLKKV